MSAEWGRLGRLSLLIPGASGTSATSLGVPPSATRRPGGLASRAAAWRPVISFLSDIRSEGDMAALVSSSPGTPHRRQNVRKLSARSAAGRIAFWRSMRRGAAAAARRRPSRAARPGCSGPIPEGRTCALGGPRDAGDRRGANDRTSAGTSRSVGPLHPPPSGSHLPSESRCRPRWRSLQSSRSHRARSGISRCRWSCSSLPRVPLSKTAHTRSEGFAGLGTRQLGLFGGAGDCSYRK